MEPLLLATQAIVWFADHKSLGASVLSTLLRARLRSAGLIRQESKIDLQDCARIHARICSLLTAADVPHFPQPTSADWVLKLLNDRDYSQPLGWATLLAATLPYGYSVPLARPTKWPEWHALENPIGSTLGLCGHSALDRDLSLARERVPQLSLFKERYGRRISHAPERLYTVLGFGLRLADAARICGMSLGECQRWMVRDVALQSHWHDSIARLRTEAACTAIRRYAASHPAAMRSDFIREENRAVRSLQRYAPELLNDLLPRWSRSMRASDFFFLE